MQLVAIILLYIMTIDNTNVHDTHTNRCMHAYIHTFHANTNPIHFILRAAKVGLWASKPTVYLPLCIRKIVLLTLELH